MLKSTTTPGPAGSVGPMGPQGPAGPASMGSPNLRSLAFATAYQATNPLKAAFITINLSSLAGLSLSGGAANSVSLVIGPTASVASGTGTVVGTYTNTLTGALTIGLGVNTTSASPLTCTLPIGWYFALLLNSGSVSIVSAFDQALG